MHTPVQIRALAAPEVSASAMHLGRVHAAAFGRDDEAAAATRYAEHSLPEMIALPDFLAVGAFAGQEIVGFACGHAATPHLPWSERVYGALHAADLEMWTCDPFEVADVAVLPAWQRHGLGRQLVNHLVTRMPYTRALLVTWHGDHPAKRFYLRCGWRLLVEDFFYLPNRPPTSILGFDRDDITAN